MTLPRINAYRKYWKSCPPTHMLVAGYMKYKPQEAGDPAELMAMFAGGVIK